MTGRFRICLVLLASTALPLTARSADAPHAFVAGFERFPDAPGAGQLLLGELNCVSCHVPLDRSSPKKQAPVLDDVGSRVKPAYLRKFLDDPLSVKPGSTMPRLLANDPDRAAKIEALTHFLASTGTPAQGRPDIKGMVLGRDHYQKVGCIACHGPRDVKGDAVPVKAVTVPLGDLKAKYTL